MSESHCPECGHRIFDQTHSPVCWTVHQGCAVERIRTLEKIVADLHFMARRYAAGRSTWVPTTFNEHTQVLLDMGVHLDDADGVLFAHHGLGRGYDPLTEEEAAQSARKALSWFEKEPEIVAAREEVERLREALRAVEWLEPADDFHSAGEKFCPLCIAEKGEAHADNCLIGKALSVTEVKAE